MIHQCPCGFATNDQLWFESHQPGIFSAVTARLSGVITI
jgi:hypothetical protein